ncbi:MAG: long-chain-fatty-acid--CoA ligase [Deltaproteobacteria bacterium]|nr:long-chain-fatty-acid--CoA ligase [Deltaproteobacteria bacterium]
MGLDNKNNEKQIINVASFLEDHINRHGKVPSLVFEDKEYTNLWIRDNANRLANGLISLGIKKGDMVVVSLQNCPEVLVLYQAILRIGAIIIPIMFNFSAEETQFILSDCEAVAFITSSEAAEKIQISLDMPHINHVIILEDDAPSGTIYYEKLISDQSDKFEITNMDEDDIALLIYTAGTTGRPKGVMLSYGNLHHHAVATYDLWDKEPRRQLSCLPLAHMFGVTAMLIDQLNRHPESVFVLMRWFDPEEIFRLIEKYKISGMGGVPTMFWILLNDPSIKKYDLSSMDQCVAGAAPVPDELRNDFEGKLNINMLEAYGLSESCSAVACTHHNEARKPGSAGTRIGKTIIKIFDDTDNELPAGESGEIVIKGPTVMKGYYKRLEETKATLRGGWLHTGDVGYMDEDGYLYVTDRKKDMIIKGGENIFPSEVENILLKHPQVAEAAVIGFPDKKYGEDVMAFVIKEADEEVTEEDIIAHCHRNYTKFKSPTKIQFIDNIPKSLVGKILKKELRGIIK